MEFNLSEKRQVRNKQNSQIYNIPYTYSEEDVKEFIKLLKENPSIIQGTKYLRVSKIDELAGDKLNGKKES